MHSILSYVNDASGSLRNKLTKITAIIPTLPSVIVNGRFTQQTHGDVYKQQVTGADITSSEHRKHGGDLKNYTSYENKHQLCQDAR